MELLSSLALSSSALPSSTSPGACATYYVHLCSKTLEEKTPFHKDYPAQVLTFLTYTVLTISISNSFLFVLFQQRKSAREASETAPLHPSTDADMQAADKLFQRSFAEWVMAMQ